VWNAAGGLLERTAGRSRERFAGRRQRLGTTANHHDLICEGTGSPWRPCHGRDGKALKQRVNLRHDDIVVELLEATFVVNLFYDPRDKS
jgi:hypothetical protein